jgi:predicted ArsR family transcriptional regulator
MHRFAYEEVEHLASVFDGLGNANRLVTFLGLYNGDEIQEITERVPISEQGVRNHAERLVDSELLYRPEDGERMYAVTPFGEFFASFLETFAPALVDALDELEKAESEVREELADTRLREQVIEQEAKRLKWEQVGEKLEDQLAGLEIGDQNDDTK